MKMQKYTSTAWFGIYYGVTKGAELGTEFPSVWRPGQYSRRGSNPGGREQQFSIENSY